jgi:aminopeptidase YwaD
MNPKRLAVLILFLPLVLLAPSPRPAAAQERRAAPPPRPPAAESPVLRTPLPVKSLNLLANEISGQIIFNNEVKLAGAPWQREDTEFSDTFYETRTIHGLVRGYGIETTRIDRFTSAAKFDYPVRGELWMLKPENRLIARLEADPALVSRSSANADITADLVYIPPLTPEILASWTKEGAPARYKDKVALMWSHANAATGKALDAAGIKAVIAFSAQNRYEDPDQVIYSGGTYSGFKSLQLGMTVSWRQWSELLEDVERGTAVSLRLRTQVETYPDRFEDVYSWIPGREPDKKGVLFTAHLFEGYVKRGANDNMSGCVVQLEILRALSALIARGDLPRPRRTIAFLWPNEISGTYEFIKQNPGLPDKLSININMDMVGEGLRINNGWLTMSECPNHLPSYLDGLTDAMMNFVWRGNDIVYTSDSPRGRLSGQNFPLPMWEKNGSRDAFRYFVHAATGGSDHLCFNNPSVAVPGIELFTWPDQWYHTDKDTPAKSDPTEMKRIAFIGAAAAWAAANCEDDILPDMLDAVSGFGFARIGDRELPAAFRKIDAADAPSLPGAVGRALELVHFAAGREKAAIASVRDVASGSAEAETLIRNREILWEGYRSGLADQVIKYAGLRAGQLKTALPPPLSGQSASGWAAAAAGRIVPALHPEVKGMEFSLESSDRYKKYIEKNPEALKGLKLEAPFRRVVLNYINGRRAAVDIRAAVAAEADRSVDLGQVVEYLEFLKAVGWIVIK